MLVGSAPDTHLESMQPRLLAALSNDPLQLPVSGWSRYSPAMTCGLRMQGTRLEQMQRWLEQLLPALVTDPAQLPVPSEEAVRELYSQVYSIAAFRVRPCRPWLS